MKPSSQTLTDRLTPEREAEITARAEAATAGPWEVELEQCDCSDGLCSHGTYVSAVYANGERRTEFSDFTDADWQFVIRARTDVPALLAELAAVRAVLGEALDDLTGANLARWEEEQDNARLRLALKSAQHGRRKARARIAEVAAVRTERDQAQKQLAEYEPLNPQQCPAGKHADWLVDSEYTHACPWCQIETLKTRVAELEGQGHLTVTDVVAWLSKKAHEYQGNRRESAADALARMASKVSRGAIRPTQGGAR